MQRLYFPSLLFLICLFMACQGQQEIIFTKKLKKININGKDVYEFIYDEKGQLLQQKRLTTEADYTNSTFDYSQKGHVTEKTNLNNQNFAILHLLDENGYSTTWRDLKDSSYNAKQLYNKDFRLISSTEFYKSVLSAKHLYEFDNSNLLKETHNVFYDPNEKIFHLTEEQVYEYDTKLQNTPALRGLKFRGNPSLNVPFKETITKTENFQSNIAVWKYLRTFTYEKDDEGYITKEAQKLIVLAKPSNVISYTLKDSVKTIIYTYE